MDPMINARKPGRMRMKRVMPNPIPALSSSNSTVDAVTCCVCSCIDWDSKWGAVGSGLHWDSKWGAVGSGLHWDSTSGAGMAKAAAVGILDAMPPIEFSTRPMFGSVV